MVSRYLVYVFVAIGAVLLLTNCIGTSSNSDPVDLYYKPSESDKLSKEEVDSLIYHAKKFISKSKSLKINDSARKIIIEQNPGCRFVYTGKKKGRVDFEWMIGDCKVFVLTARGDLTSEHLTWYVQVKSIYVSDPYLGSWTSDSQK